MDEQTRSELIEKLHQESVSIQKSKGKAYAGDGDTLANFKRNAINLGLSKYQVWAVYFNKHIDSINNAVKANPQFPVDQSEGLEGRIMDAKNYLDILYCLITEDVRKGK